MENWVGMVPSLLLSPRTISWKLMPFKEFAMELCSFGKKEDPCGAIEWATNDSAMVPLISCEADMSSWLKAKYPGSGASGIRGRPGEMTSGSCGKKVSNYTCLVA